MTVCELQERMTYEELALWSAYYEWTADLQREAQRKASRSAVDKTQVLGRRLGGSELFRQYCHQGFWVCERPEARESNCRLK